MELKDLLELKEPTLEQYAEMEKQLLAIARAATAEIESLDAEGLARGADRLLGRDDGGEARSVARALAEQRRTDAQNVLSEVRGKAASLEARLEKEADDRAWAEVQKHLDERIKAMNEIDSLCSKIGELYEVVVENGRLAETKAPAKPNYREDGFNNLPGRLPAQLATAIMARLHISVDRPFARLAISNEQFSEAYDRTIRIQGLAGYLGPIHNAILMKNV